MLSLLLFASLSWAQDSQSTYDTFRSAPGLHVPQISVNKSGAPLAEGLLFMTVSDGPVIMTDSGDLVWNGPDGFASNLFVQSLDDKPILTFWNGSGSLLGRGNGQVNILDTDYNQLYTICPDITVMTTEGTATGCNSVDLHESFVTTRGTILCTIVNVTNADLTSVGGPSDGWVFDSMFMEIDIKTNDILFLWSPLRAGIPINSTKEDLGSSGTSRTDPFDWFHMNSVTTLKDGYLANSRHTWTSYALDTKGEVQWRLEGSNGGDFSLPAAGNFSWQHHVRVQNETQKSLVLHMFNDMNESGDLPSNGLELHLDLDKRNATIKNLYIDRHDEIATTSQGSYQVFSNKNVLLGYGNRDYIKEFGAEGDVRMSISGAASYRVYRELWDATPAGYPPNTTAVEGEGWVSWNGDTRTTKWVVYAGASNDSLSKVGEVARTGFETNYSLPSGSKWVKVGAFAGDDHLRDSSVVPVGN
ncbi:hypothetical protein F52700_8990 [Fusarium sp. NRRL 52700]|nr:hypothetical protein F52700_8990 [Fusarium sp. NRRL 52700]